MSINRITKQLENVLTEDEEIEKIFPLTGCNVVATNKRLIELKENTTTDYDYAHISSIEYSSKNYRWMIVPGIIFLIAAFYFRLEIRWLWYLLSVTGGLLIVGGIWYKPEWVKIYVVGVPDPVKYEGSRENLELLFNIVRKKHFAGKKETD